MSEHRPKKHCECTSQTAGGARRFRAMPAFSLRAFGEGFLGDREPVPPLVTVFSEISKGVDQNGRRRRENCGVCRRNPSALPVEEDASRRARRHARPNRAIDIHGIFRVNDTIELAATIGESF
jgi:hypothetical protein